MNKGLVVGKHTFKAHISSKIFSYSLFFSLILFLFIAFLSSLSFGGGSLILKNSGLFFIEFINLLIVVYISSTYILKEIEEKSIYLILTKGVKKSQYIFGINLSLIYLITMNTFLMGGVLILISSLENSFDLSILIGILFIILKLSIVASIGVLFSTIVESPLFAMIGTLSVYLIGHFLGEIGILIKYTNSEFLKGFLKVTSTIFPKFYLLNYRDYLISEFTLKEEGLLILYSIAYLVILVFVSSIAFKKKQL